MDEEGFKRDKAAINDFWDRSQSEDLFATTVEDSNKLADIAWRYMNLYETAVAANEQTVTD